MCRWKLFLALINWFFALRSRLGLSDTAYRRFKINPSAKELNDLYTPTVYELAFARERARQPLQRAGL
jgi:hypothetical protein